MERKGLLIPAVLHSLKKCVNPGQAAPEEAADLSDGRILEPLGLAEIVGPTLHLPYMRGGGVDTVPQEKPAQGVKRTPVGIPMADEPIIGGDT